MVANRSSDFNYKVALASGLKSLQGGRLRAAEEQFRYLVKHFPSAEGGYRGLAKVLVEQEDRTAAVRILLQGGAALAKADQRPLATQLYREAMTLDPNDLAAHRRLAAALALGGQTDDAAHEYVRFIQNAMAHGDDERAKLETVYALERLPGKDEIAEAATVLGIEVPPPPPPRPGAEEPAPAPLAAAPLAAAAKRGTPRQPRLSPREPAPDAWNAPTTTSNDASAAARLAAIQPPPAKAEMPAKDPWAKAAEPTGAPEAAADGKRPENTSADAPPAQTVPVEADGRTVEATAAEYLANGDQRGGQAALEAARRYIAEGRMDAASDLLLQLIASGIARHDAQRLLVDVTKSMGKSDLTKTKLRLLVEALRLDGRTELAAEVEQAAQAE